INCWIERDRDQLIRRTAHRPLPHGDVAPEGALVFGLVLEALAFALLWSTVNLLSAVLAVSAMLFYVFVYTMWLKPRSSQTFVIGRDTAPAQAIRFFTYSNTYLALLFAAVAVDTLVHSA